ncbi:unnamed protein product, partial [Nesidiocoris tenuis]
MTDSCFRKCSYLWMCVALPVHDSVESIVVVSRIFDDPLGSIRFDKRVTAFDNVSISDFRLTLDVTCMSVVDSVLKFVLRMRINVLDVLGSDGDFSHRSVHYGCGVDYRSGMYDWSRMHDRSMDYGGRSGVSDRSCLGEDGLARISDAVARETVQEAGCCQPEQHSHNGQL